MPLIDHFFPDTYGLNANSNSDSSTTTNGNVNTEHAILEGPLFIPNFDQFITASAAISNSSLNSNQFIQISATTSVGQGFGNLLHFGDLHFAPAGQEGIMI